MRLCQERDGVALELAEPAVIADRELGADDDYDGYPSCQATPLCVFLSPHHLILGAPSGIYIDANRCKRFSVFSGFVLARSPLSPQSYPHFCLAMDCGPLSGMFDCGGRMMRLFR